MKTKEEQIEDLKATAVKLQQQIEALENPKQWEPRSCRYINTQHTERATVEDAVKASAEMRTYSRLLAYVDEFGGDWEADWEDKQQAKYSVYYDYASSSWDVNAKRLTRLSGAVYMSRECAVGLYAKLNSGEVVL